METKRFVLLVEDSYNDELLARRAFKQCQLADRLTVVHDGAEALDFLFGTGSHAKHETTELPAMVLLDLKLPKLNGFEVLRRVRANERTQLLPVVILSSSDEEDDRNESKRLGANAYLRKPVEFKEFVTAVRRLTLCWLEGDGTLDSGQK
ncbi:MAG TPA: response regulator [Verrucomicrobiae bacterium]|nr:response regulator [Verrucomicrobiae bacterium]